MSPDDVVSCVAALTMSMGLLTMCGWMVVALVRYARDK
jgi:ABC-type transport system involved in cytochrome bd biosynthesis fused ATPase/permease subunit